ncbi:MAG TPA: hypothetical protein VKB76_07005, partial [Ktedonobacterales bacterium]|nr:hypothetical protein [Ktedonobacterales bacterium]
RPIISLYIRVEYCGIFVIDRQLSPILTAHHLASSAIDYSSDGRGHHWMGGKDAESVFQQERPVIRL